MSEVYRIGIAILLADNTAAGLSRISHRLLGVHATVGQINASFGKWATLIGGTASCYGIALELRRYLVFVPEEKADWSYGISISLKNIGTIGSH